MRLPGAYATSNMVWGACLAIAAFFVLVPRALWEGFLHNWAAVSGILAFLVALGVYLRQQHKKWEDEERKDLKRQLVALRAILEELKDNLSAITGKRYIKLVEDPGADGGILSFTARHLYHRSMDGTTYGGQFPVILERLRRQLNDLYARIEMHNYYLRHLFELTGGDTSGDVKAALSCYRMLARDGEVLGVEIPQVMQALKDVESRISRPRR